MSVEHGPFSDELIQSNRYRPDENSEAHKIEQTVPNNEDDDQEQFSLTEELL